jgi:predicted CoA-binding protein
MSSKFCEFPLANASDEEIKAILEEAKTVAVVGLSDNPERESHQVAAYLKAQGYRIIPVNPNVQEVLGERAYPTLGDIPKDIKVDVVDIWMQKGLAHNAAADKARAAGLAVVMDRCMMVEHRRLVRG